MHLIVSLWARSPEVNRGLRSPYDSPLDLLKFASEPMVSRKLGWATAAWIFANHLTLGVDLGDGHSSAVFLDPLPHFLLIDAVRFPTRMLVPEAAGRACHQPPPAHELCCG